MTISTPMLPGLSPVGGKKVVAQFDGGLLSSDAGVLALREIEQRLCVAERLAACIVDPRTPEQIVHSPADIIRFRLLMISAGHEDGNDANSLRADPVFKMAHDLAPSQRDLCSQSTISRLENLPDARALLRMGRALVDLYCETFSRVPKRITLDIDDTFDAVHGAQQLRLFNAHYDEYGFQPIVVFDGEGRFITAVLRPAKRPSGKEIRGFVRRLVRTIRTNWPRVEILLRGDSHYCCPEVLDFCRVNKIDYIIGNGYTGGKNVNVGLDRADVFGISVSLDGTRLAVGASNDDGATGGLTGSGAVYLFSFSDLAFNGSTLEGIIGNGYSGPKDINVALDTFDQFGSSVSLDGTNLAVGTPGDNIGRVYLFSFSDLGFNGGQLEGIIGSGYTGGKNVNVVLDPGDLFGVSVSLDGARLAVGASGGTGAVYLFSFTDLAFNSGSLEATIGNGYTGAKDVDVALDGSDLFGYSVSLDGNRLAVGASWDDGATNGFTNTNTGAVYLFSFRDLAFNDGMLEGIIGNGYTGGKNVNIGLDASDYFGWSVSLDGTRLAVGVKNDRGATGDAEQSGAVYLFTDPFGLGGSEPVFDAVYGTRTGETITITPTDIAALLNAGNNVILQASNDGTINAPILVENPSGNGGNLMLQAGRSLTINADIFTDNGDLTLIGNDLAANGVVDADRDPGDASIVLADGVMLNVGSGSLRQAGHVQTVQAVHRALSLHCADADAYRPHRQSGPSPGRFAVSCVSIPG